MHSEDWSAQVEEDKKELIPQDHMYITASA